LPIYQYACTDCGADLEVRQSFTDDALTTCPTCDGRLRKVLSAVGVVFKGSGFYRTDSRAEPSGDKAAAGSESASKDSKDGSGKDKAGAGEASTSDSSAAKASNSTSSPSSKSGSSTPAATTS